jgi:hypothetical protein
MAVQVAARRDHFEEGLGEISSVVVLQSFFPWPLMNADKR